MIQEIIDLQNNAVSNLLQKIEEKDDIVFKAPTGSGKTYMMADLMDRVLSNNKDIIFLVSSLSKSGLAKQNFDKFEEYVFDKKFTHINPYLITSDTTDEEGVYIPTDYNVYVLPRDSYKEKNSKLKNTGALKNFLDTITSSSFFGKNKKIYLIKDECHIKTTNLDELKEYFKKVLNFSATPNSSRGQKPDVEINEIDAINTHLIKSVEYGKEEDSLENALDKFKLVKEQYQKSAEDKSFGKSIHPCLIIQISNKDKADKEIDEIKRILDKKEYQDLQWMLITNDNNGKGCDTNNIIKKMPVSRWKDEAKKSDSTIDIIIFKMIITEGWDIPRACMLYQVRDTKSKQLEEQVIGRVRRNPKLLEFEKLTDDSKKLVTTAYVWGMVNKDENSSIQEVKLVDGKIQSEIKVKITRIKPSIELNTIKDIDNVLKNKQMPLVCDDIFTLYKKYQKQKEDIKNITNNIIKKYQDWFLVASNIDDISKEIKSISCDYNENMELVTNENGEPVEVSLPLVSYYIDNGNYERMGKWLWRKIGGDDQFSFDSKSEAEWAAFLYSLTNDDAPNNNGRLVKSMNIDDDNKYLIGKNYLSNSDIKYEYYLYGIHSSYPDFIMKDYKNRIHIFESKSLNESNNINISKEEYEEKLKALQECYKAASKITGYYFYIPTKKNNDWTIFQYCDGFENRISKEELRKFLKM